MAQPQNWDWENLGRPEGEQGFLHVGKNKPRSIQKKGVLVILSPGSGVNHAHKTYWTMMPGKVNRRTGLEETFRWVCTGFSRAAPRGRSGRQTLALALPSSQSASPLHTFQSGGGFVSSDGRFPGGCVWPKELFIL